MNKKKLKALRAKAHEVAGENTASTKTIYRRLKKLVNSGKIEMKKK